jgi:hypothetical protein
MPNLPLPFLSRKSLPTGSSRPRAELESSAHQQTGISALLLAHVFNSAGHPWRSAGSDVFHLDQSYARCEYNNKLNGGRWIECTWKADDGWLYGWDSDTRVWLTSGSATEFLRSFSIGSGLDLVTHRAAGGKSCPWRAQRLPCSSPKTDRNQPTPCQSLARHLSELHPKPTWILPSAYPESDQTPTTACPDSV